VQAEWLEEWEQDGCLYMQLPGQIVDVAQLSFPTGMHGCHCFKHNDRACWKSRCGCFRVANKAKKGLTSQQLHDNSLACQKLCSSRSTKCFCHVLDCHVCGRARRLEAQGKPVHQEGLMWRETQRVVQERKSFGHDWLVFVEVPVNHVTGNSESAVLYIDMMLVLHGVWSGVPAKQCMLAIEHQGTTHHNARSVGGDKLAGYDRQRAHDARKAAAVESLDIDLLYFIVERRDVLCGELSSLCSADWASKLTAKLIEKEEMAIAEHGDGSRGS
jgi:hypothetical protein